jgi:hypothetical protein
MIVDVVAHGKTQFDDDGDGHNDTRRMCVRVLRHVGCFAVGVGVAVVAFDYSGSLPRAIAFAIVFSERYASVLRLFTRCYTIVQP